MIQILSLRNGEAWFERGIRAPSVEAIFKNPLEFISDKTEPSERWNVYYTVAECLEEKGRKLSVQHHIPFDIDKITIPDVDMTPYLEGVARVACQAIGVPYDKVGVLFSGNGLQILVGTIHPILDKEYFKDKRLHYRALCEKINEALKRATLTGEADPAVWSPARLMRYPNTINRKPNRPERTGKILQGNIERLDFRVDIASGIPEVPLEETVNKSVFDTFPTPDTKAIMSECNFLKWCQAFPEQVSEPQWFAMCGITGRLQDGRAFTHQLSSGHPGYSFSEAEAKIDQALESSGPRLCTSINNLSDKCRGCKYLGTKVTTPLLIQGPDFIRTEKTGFYNVHQDEKGNVKRGKPNYHDLQKKFAKDYHYKVTPEGMFWVWKDTHYEAFDPIFVKHFAETHFNPKPSETMRNEFLSTCRMYGLTETEWFSGTTEGKLNFKNGVFNIALDKLEPTTTENGFRVVLPCEYSPTATAPRWEKFIEEVTCERKDLAAILQEYMGYIFAGSSCKFEKMLMLVGEGANGKSTLVKIIRALAGETMGASNLSIKNLNDSQNRALLEGKLCNIAEENSKDSFKDVELIKNMVSGGMVQVKRLYMQPYEFQNYAKLVMLCNEVPRSMDHTHGFFRKILMIPFDRTFSDEAGDKDNDIFDKLMLELPGIFNWVVEGYKKLVAQRKFTEATASTMALIEYKMESDPIYSWFDEACEVTKEIVEANRSEMYSDFVQWCQSEGAKYVPSRTALHKFIKIRLKSQGIVPIEKKKSKDGIRYWTISNIKFNQKATF